MVNINTGTKFTIAVVADIKCVRAMLGDDQTGNWSCGSDCGRVDASSHAIHGLLCEDCCGERRCVVSAVGLLWPHGEVGWKREPEHQFLSAR